MFSFVFVMLNMSLALASDPLSGVQWHPQKPSEYTGTNKHEGTAYNVQKAPDNEKDHSSPFEMRLIETLRLLVNEEKAAREQRRADEKPWRSPSMWIDLGLLVVGFFYTRAAFRQLRVTEDSLIETRKAADAATRSAGVAESALKLTERAYLSFEGWEFDAPSFGKRENMQSGITVHLTNAGRTPATLIGFYGEYREMVPGLLEYKKFLDREWRNVTVPPQGRYSMPICFPAGFTYQDYREVRGSKRGCYIFAYIEYIDMFGETHETATLVGSAHETGVGMVFKVIPAPDYNYAT